MTKITVFSLFVALLFMKWDNVALVESSDTSKAKVIGAMQRKDNPYMAVVENEDVKSGWAIEIKKTLSEAFTSAHLIVFFYVRTDPKAELEEAFASPLCFLTANDDEYKNFLPKQIGGMMFPKQKGSCDFTESERAIRATAQVSTNPDDNIGFFLKTPPYELEVRVVEYNHKKTEDLDPSDYLLKVNFNIGGDINKN